MKKVVWVLAALPLALLPIRSASADVLYSDGPVNGTVDAWTINFGYQVSDTFTLSAPSTVTGVQFNTWEFPGDGSGSVQYVITSADNPGTNPPSVPNPGTTADYTAADGYTNTFGFTIYTDTFSTGSLNLAAGTYWLSLENANVPSSDPVYWDQNNGPSVAYENSVGYLNGPDGTSGGGAESFEILGTEGATVPEPSGVAAFAIGIATLAGLALLRRKSVGASLS